mgnify:CR=1 FL=1
MEGCSDEMGMELEPEHWDIVPNPEFGGAPCPHAVASAIRGSAASDSDILNWLHVLTMELTAGSPDSATSEDDFSYTGDVGQLSGDEAFGIGFEAGKRGL